MPLYYQVVHKLSATDSGLALIPVVILTTPGSMMSGRSMMYLRDYRIGAWRACSASWAVAALVLVAHPPTAHRAIVAGLRRGSASGSAACSRSPPCRYKTRSAPSDRHRDRRHELLPGAREHAGRGRDGRDRARRTWGYARARRRVVVGVRRHRGERLARRSRTALSATFSRWRWFSWSIGVVALIIMEERPLRTTVLAAPATRDDAAAGARGVAPSSAAA